MSANHHCSSAHDSLVALEALLEINRRKNQSNAVACSASSTPLLTAYHVSTPTSMPSTPSSNIPSSIQSEINNFIQHHQQNSQRYAQGLQHGLPVLSLPPAANATNSAMSVMPMNYSNLQLPTSGTISAGLLPALQSLQKRQHQQQAHPFIQTRPHSNSIGSICGSSVIGGAPVDCSQLAMAQPKHSVLVPNPLVPNPLMVSPPERKEDSSPQRQAVKNKLKRDLRPEGNASSASPLQEKKETTMDGRTASSCDIFLSPPEEDVIRSEEIEAALRSKPQRGKKRGNLSLSERVELTRTRNREHAKSTRIRKKARYQELLERERLWEQYQERELLDKRRRSSVVDFTYIRSDSMRKGLSLLHQYNSLKFNEKELLTPHDELSTVPSVSKLGTEDDNKISTLTTDMVNDGGAISRESSESINSQCSEPEKPREFAETNSKISNCTSPKSKTVKLNDVLDDGKRFRYKSRDTASPHTAKGQEINKGLQALSKHDLACRELAVKRLGVEAANTLQISIVDSANGVALVGNVAFAQFQLSLNPDPTSGSNTGGKDLENEGQVFSSGTMRVCFLSGSNKIESMEICSDLSGDKNMNSVVFFPTFRSEDVEKTSSSSLENASLGTVLPYSTKRLLRYRGQSFASVVSLDTQHQSSEGFHFAHSSCDLIKEKASRDKSGVIPSQVETTLREDSAINDSMEDQDSPGMHI